MGLTVQEREIGGIRFKVTTLPYSKARELRTRLLQLLGPALAKAAERVAGDAEIVTLGDLPIAALGAGLGELVTQLTPRDFELAETLIAGHTEFSTDGERWLKLGAGGQMDLLFAGRHEVAMRWLAFGLEVNFGSFFGDDGLGALFQRAKGSSGSRSQSTSTGSSTGSHRAGDTTTP
ncbi:MAG: hypothetical protein L6Q76_00080 [Polyangiaceae bacterium]|nr:hypothetical protein [Polyangiaceae bacterium]